MKDNLLSAFLGFTLSAITLGWGDLFKASIVGFMGAIGGLLANWFWQKIKKWLAKKRQP